MRTVSATALAKAQADDGVESMVVVEVNLPTGKLYFGDRELGGVEDRIKSLGNVNITLSDKGATAGSISVELDDSDEYFLNLLCSTRFEGRTVRILQVFDGDVADAVELLVGRVGSPVVWEEEDRCFKFDVVAFYQSADNEVPYAPEEENSDLAEAAWNKPWPRIYGTPIDVPATQVTYAPTGTLLRELKPNDSYFDIEVRDDVEFPLGETITVQVGNEWITGQFEELEDDPSVVLRFYILARNVTKGTIYSHARTELTSIEDPPSGWEETWALDPRYSAWGAEGLVLAGNWLFLIDAPDQIGAGAIGVASYPAAHLYGSYTVPSFVGNKNYILYQKGNATRGQLPWFGPGGLMFLEAGAKADVRGVLDVNDTLWPAGTTVEQVLAVKYVCSDLPADAVLRVRAWREVKLDERGGRKRELVVLPSSFYTVRLNDTVDGRACSTIELERTLSSRGAGWENELFITLTRGDGNIADIITEILEDAGLTVDTGTVEEDCAAYPMNFAVLERQDSLSLAQEIAWQGRCGLSVIGSTATLKYLSLEPTVPVYVYQDPLEGMLQLTTTEIDQVVNDLWVQWKKRYSQTEPGKLHYRNADSVEAYGRKKQNLDIWVYRHKRLVQKTAQFWFNRMSRVWRRMRIVTDIDSIEATVYDDVKSLLPELTTFGMLESVEHDTDNCSIAHMIWTPVEVGTCVQSENAYLEDDGDTAPGTPAFSDPGDVAEVIEVSPLDLSLSEPEVRVGEATADEVNTGGIYGVFDARLYRTNENSGEQVSVGTVSVKNLSPGQLIRSGDVVTIFKAEDGTYYSAPGAAASSTYWGTVTALGAADDPHITVDIYAVADDNYEFVEEAPVLYLGETLPEVGDEILVFRSSDGTYWTKAATTTQPVGLAEVSTDSADKNAIPARLYDGSTFTGEIIYVKVPTLQTTAKISAGTQMVVIRFGEQWVGYVALIRPRVPA